jgi:hypothetical protein
MKDRRTISGQALLTTLLFETKSTMYCCQLPFFAHSSSNTVHLSFKTALVVQVIQFFLYITFSLKPKNSYANYKHLQQSEWSKPYLFKKVNRNQMAHPSHRINNVTTTMSALIHFYWYSSLLFSTSYYSKTDCSDCFLL